MNDARIEGDDHADHGDDRAHQNPPRMQADHSATNTVTTDPAAPGEDINATRCSMLSRLSGDPAADRADHAMNRYDMAFSSQQRSFTMATACRSRSSQQVVLASRTIRSPAVDGHRHDLLIVMGRSAIATRARAALAAVRAASAAIR